MGRPPRWGWDPPVVQVMVVAMVMRGRQQQPFLLSLHPRVSESSFGRSGGCWWRSGLALSNPMQVVQSNAIEVEFKAGSGSGSGSASRFQVEVQVRRSGAVRCAKGSGSGVVPSGSGSGSDSGSGAVSGRHTCQAPAHPYNLGGNRRNRGGACDLRRCVLCVLKGRVRRDHCPMACPCSSLEILPVTFMRPSPLP